MSDEDNPLERTPEELDEDVPTWAPIDLEDALNGTFRVDPPEYMVRSDGIALLYPGKIHSLQGESESGKSMVAQAEVAEALKRGHPCLYIDFESDQGTVVGRLLAMGCTPDQVRSGLHYVRPDINPHAINEIEAFTSLLRNQYRLAIIDGVTEAFAVFGVKSNDNDEVTAWGRIVPKRIAAATGAATLLIDHVTKSEEGRGRFAIGAQAKLSYLTGATYTIEPVEPIGVGMSGRLAIRVGKDRPGLVRPHAGTYRKTDRTQPIAVAVIDSTQPGIIAYSLEPYTDGPEAKQNGWMPTAIMENISKALQAAGEPLTLRTINEEVKGKRDTIQTAIQELSEAGHIRVEPGPRNSHLHHFIRPYPDRGTLTDLKAV